MPRRQTIPIDEVRAPPYINDQMTAAEVRQGVNDQTSLQSLVNIIASQVRILSGATGWLDAAPPGATNAFSGELVVGEKLDGRYDGNNQVFATARYFVPGTLSVAFNGIFLTAGVTADYLPVETAGPGTGFNGVKLTGYPPPRERDVLSASYVRTG